MSDHCPICGVNWKNHGTACPSIGGSSNIKPKLSPYKCPVCDGSGKVSRPPDAAGDVNQWASTGSGLYDCNACEGTGIIWSPA